MSPVTEDDEFADIKQNNYLIAVESGEVFDMEGSLAFKFPGGYPLILKNGEYIVNQHGLLTRYRKNGDIRFQFNDNFTHDWDYFEDERLIYLSRFHVKEGRRSLRTAELKIIDRRGKQLKRFDFYKNREKLEAQLEVFLEPVFFSFTYVAKKFGIPFWCNCWEFDHFNYVQVLKNPLVISENTIIPKETILTSFPMKQRVFGLNLDTFDVVWSIRLPEIHFFHTPIFTSKNTMMIFANNFRDGEKIIEKSALVEYDLVTGQELLRYYLPDELYSPISGSIQEIKDGKFLISIFTGEIFLFDRKSGVRPFADLRKNYQDRKIDFYKAVLFDKSLFPDIKLVN